MSDVIAINAEGMNKLVNEFDEEAERIQRVWKMLQSDMDQCKNGGWIAESADTYYQHMDSDVMPSVERLARGLREASDVMRQVMDVFGAAEDEASSFLRGS